MVKKRLEDAPEPEPAAVVVDRLPAFADWFYQRAGKMHPPEIAARVAAYLTECGFRSPREIEGPERQAEKARQAPYSHGDTQNVPAKAPLAGRPGDADWWPSQPE